MNLNDKLKQASLEAELLTISQIPDDSEINWTPSDSFLKKMEKVFKQAERPIIKTSFLRKFSAVAAVLIFACAAVLLPVNHYYGNTDGKYAYSAGDGNKNNVYGSNDGIIIDISETDRNQSLGVPCDDSDDVVCGVSDDPSENVETLPFFPSYIPSGYQIVNSVVQSDNVTTLIEFSNGKDSFTFYSSAEGLDISDYQNSYVLDWNSNSYYANVKPPNTDGNNVLDGNTNNFVWFYGSNTFMLVGNESLSLEEMQKTAISFNLEPNE